MIGERGLRMRTPGFEPSGADASRAHETGRQAGEPEGQATAGRAVIPPSPPSMKKPRLAGFFSWIGEWGSWMRIRVRTERRERAASSQDWPAGRRARRASDRRSRSNPSLSAIHEKAPPRGFFFLDRRVGIMDENPGSNRAARTRRELTRLAGRPASPRGKRLLAPACKVHFSPI